MTKRKVAVVLIAAAMAVSACARRERPRPVVDETTRRMTTAGEVVGFEGEYGNHAWLGIPYAAPPVGGLRWRAPRPPEPWTGTRTALEPGSACMQYGSLLGGVAGAKPGEPAGSEDCLYLNVYAPRFAPADVPRGTERLPIMVWIHGGGNSIGEAAFYNGGNLAATHRVVVVAINYRLGPFGWFRHAALRGDGTSALDQSGNFGTLDHLRALEWVRDNAAAFGGDPDNVTIFGESAGGVDVFTLLRSPPAQGLFHRAVVQSGGLRAATAVEAEHLADAAEPGNANSSNEALLRLLVADGTARDREGAKATLAGMSADDVARYLRGKTSGDILAVYEPMPGMGMIDMPLVIADGTVVPAGDPLQQFARGEYNRVPVVIGTNRDENKLFMFADPTLVRRILWIFPRLRDERWYTLSAEYLSAMWKATGADQPAAAMRGAQGPSVFVYRFDWDEEPTILGADLSVMLGAAHALEIPFVFGHFDLGREGNMIFSAENEPGRRALAEQMMAYWAAFAYDGAPGRGRGGQRVEWTAWDNSNAGAPKFLIFDTSTGGGVRMSAESVTAAGLLAAVDVDPRLPTQRDKCMMYRVLATRSRGLTKEEYPTAGKQGCREFPFDAFPWE